MSQISVKDCSGLTNTLNFGCGFLGNMTLGNKWLISFLYHEGCHPFNCSHHTRYIYYVEYLHQRVCCWPRWITIILLSQDFGQIFFHVLVFHEKAVNFTCGINWEFNGHWNDYSKRLSDHSHEMQQWCTCLFQFVQNSKCTNVNILSLVYRNWCHLLKIAEV